MTTDEAGEALHRPAGEAEAQGSPASWHARPECLVGPEAAPVEVHALVRGRQLGHAQTRVVRPITKLARAVVCTTGTGRPARPTYGFSPAARCSLCYSTRSG